MNNRDRRPVSLGESTTESVASDASSGSARRRRGRPRSGQAKRRTVVVRLEDEDHTRLQQRALSLGLTVSEYIRSLIQTDIGATQPVVNEVEPVSDENPGMYDKGRVRKREIAGQALEAFSALGFGNVSLRDIARRSGLSHQSLMHYFPTKDALIRAALELRDERLVQHFADGVNADELIALARDNATRPGHVAMFNITAAEASAPDHTAHAYYAAFYRDLVSALAIGLAGQTSDSEKAARLLLAMMDGLQLQWLFEPGSFAVADLLTDGAASLGIDVKARAHES